VEQDGVDAPAGQLEPPVVSLAADLHVDRRNPQPTLNPQCTWIASPLSNVMRRCLPVLDPCQHLV